ncbi:MAG TPA: hypothetical protein QF557_16855 [Myxococcota bacterium]|nr:hypothetical protein [Myxococcota bacterium]
MSTILKALRRLEEERGADGERPLREAVTSSPGRAHSSRGLFGWGLGAALVVAFSAAALVFWSVRGEVSSQQATVPEAGIPAPAAEAGVPVQERGIPAAVAEAGVPAPAAEAGVPVQERGIPAAVAEAGIPAPAAEAGVPVQERGIPAAVAEAGVPPAALTRRAAPRGTDRRPKPVETATGGELPAAAYASPVERVDRPLAEPRIAESAEQPPETEGVTAAVGNARRAAVNELSGSHKFPSAIPGTAAVTALPASRSGAVASSEPDPWEQTAAASARPPVPGPALEVVPAADSALPTPKVAKSVAAPVAQAKPAPVVKAVEAQPSAAPLAQAAPVVKAVEAQPSAAPLAQAAPVVKAVEAQPSAAPVAKPKLAPVAKAAKPKPVGKAQLEGVRVAQTTWHPSAARRTAVVTLASGDEREVHEGDEVGGLVISKIEPSGVVFRDGSAEVRRRIGEQ